jgi:hypothetical protein
MAEVQLSEVHAPLQGLADSGRESMALGDDAPPVTPQSSLGSSTVSDASSAASQFKNPKVVADSDLKDKTKISRRISDTASGVDMVNAAQIELRNVDPAVSFCLFPSPLTAE